MNKLIIENVEYVAVLDILERISHMYENGGADANNLAVALEEELLYNRCNRNPLCLQPTTSTQEKIKSEELKRKIIYNCDKNGRYLCGALTFSDVTAINTIKNNLLGEYILLYNKNECWYTVLEYSYGNLLLNSSNNFEVVQ
jgi:hypothetical protein